MVERVARAIWGAFRVWGPPIRSDKPAWEYLGESNQHLACEMARGAIAAMREPTEAMVDAGRAKDDRTTPYVQAEECEVHWCAMIDAALKEPPNAPT